MERQVFLGGSCDPTSWREDTAIPILEEAGVDFFNPQVADWHEGLIELEAQAKEESEVLLFVIDDETRAIGSMLEAAEYISTGRTVFLVIEKIADGTEVGRQVITGRELRDLNRARSFLLDLTRRHDNARVFDTVESAALAAAALLAEAREPA